MEKIEDYDNNVSHCERCDSKVEPYLSMQWFVKIKPLAEKAIKAVKDDNIKIIPERFNKTYFEWMENIIDWCISRQLWWGHRIPAWFCNICEYITVSIDVPGNCNGCKSKDIYQDPDVLDTWFSSGLWTHSALGWPNNTEDLNKFYPTTVMETGYDILFFWVARMIMLGIENMGQSPFSHVYLHGLILDPQGLKMSKSKGNVMNPVELIDEYGADALRFAITTGISPGNNQKIDERKIESARNFANKIWNASRFTLSKINNAHPPNKKLSIYDEWIMDKLNNTIKNVNDNLEAFNFGEAQKELYEFFWNEFCDWYIEFYKTHENKQNSYANLVFVLQTSIKLLHPFLPFMTEKIWQIINSNLPETLNKFKNEKSVMSSSYPTNSKSTNNTEEIDYLIKIIKSIRNIRSELKIAHKHMLKIHVSDKSVYSELLEHSDVLLNLSKSEIITSKPTNNFPIAVENTILDIEIPGELSIPDEIDRIKSEIIEIQQRILPLEKRIKSPSFYNNAPKEIVVKEKERLTDQKNRILQLEEILKSIS